MLLPGRLAGAPAGYKGRSATEDSCERLANDPTTSSGEGIARACSVPSRQSASVPNVNLTENAAMATKCRTQLKVRITVNSSANG
jgi:hypothetical protein